MKLTFGKRESQASLCVQFPQNEEREEPKKPTQPQQTDQAERVSDDTLELELYKMALGSGRLARIGILPVASSKASPSPGGKVVPPRVACCLRQSNISRAVKKLRFCMSKLYISS